VHLELSSKLVCDIAFRTHPPTPPITSGEAIVWLLESEHTGEGPQVTGRGGVPQEHHGEGTARRGLTGSVTSHLLCCRRPFLVGADMFLR
jgi:hypothetical protein